MKRRRALLFTISVVLALCAACGWWLHKERQQYALNRQLIEALGHNDTATALMLVNAGADPNTCFAPPPASTFAFIIDQLLHHAPPANDSPTALMFACGEHWNPAIDRPGAAVTFDENLPLLKAMLIHGANVNASGVDGSTALISASVDVRLHTVELLLQHGANINAQERLGRTSLMYAGADDTMSLPRLLLSQGANPNVPDCNGNTALHYAINETKPKRLIPELLAHGADLTLRNKRGWTPLQMAQQEGRFDLVRLLTRGGK